MSKLRVMVYGLGPVGRGIASAALQRDNVEVVAAVDIDPNLVGNDLGESLGMPSTGVIIRTAKDALGSTQADVVLHATGSSLQDVAPQIEQLVGAGLSVVSTCEELSFPWLADVALAGRLDAAACDQGVSVLGTGVNPGFAMDALPLMLSAACLSVEKVSCVRVLDAGKRRVPLMKKVGVGIRVEEFEERRVRGAIGHVGLRQSVAMIAAGFGWELDQITETLVPIIAEMDASFGAITTKRGDVCGIREIAAGVQDGRERIVLDLSMYAGALESFDVVAIDGYPELKVRVEGGLPGDQCTAAVVLNAAYSIANARPGLLTMLDVPLVHALLGSRLKVGQAARG